MIIKQILRSLSHDKLNNAVIIVSLSIGIACINLIFLFLRRELSTDSFHQFKEQIYLLKCDDPWLPGKKMYYCKFGSAEFMKENFAQIEDYCRFSNSSVYKIVADNNEYIDDTKIIRASQNFFSFFSYKLLTNNPVSALESSNNLIISDDLAHKYFGDENPVGKIITLANRSKQEQMTVTGIFRKPVENTQIDFDMVRLIGNVDSRCYVRLVKNSDPKEIEKLFLEKKAAIPVINTGTPVPYYLEPLHDAYFDTLRGWSVELNRDKRDLWIALIIGLMITGIAIFNYLGILANKFHRKVKEYYLRRINGSSIRQLLIRIIVENSIIVGISFMAGLFLMADLLPFFNSITNSNISKSFIWQPDQVGIIATVFIILLAITLIFALFMIRSNLDLNHLKTNQVLSIRSIQIPVFNILQISGSIALVICSLIIIRQMNYINNKPIGLNKEVIEVRIPPEYKEKAVIFKGELLKASTVAGVSVVGASPVLEHFLVALKYKDSGEEKEYSTAVFLGDENYLDVLGIELIEGAGFTESLSPNTKKCLINQSMAKLFPERDLIGKGVPGMEDMVITGIVKDFNYSDLKSIIEPAIISFDQNGGHLLVKASANQLLMTRNAIISIWQKLVPDYPVDIESVGDRFTWFHRGNENFKKLIISCSLISLFLSMIGLFAVSYQKTRSCIKAAGIRKINGACSMEILILINKDFLRWVVIAFFIALPVSWYAMYRWLENYAYRTDVKWWVYALSGLIVLSISFFTISWHSLRTATKNPVEALRYE
jgi:putative ABC transport system permease protein